MRDFSVGKDALVIRPARAEDSGFIETLYSASRTDLRKINAETEFIEELVSMQYRAQVRGYGEAFPDASYFIAEFQGVRIGRIVVNFETDHVRLINIALVREAQRRGYGRRILVALQSAAAKNHVPLKASVAWDNVAARRLYQSLNFIADGADAVSVFITRYPTHNGEDG